MEVNSGFVPPPPPPPAHHWALKRCIQYPSQPPHSCHPIDPPKEKSPLNVTAVAQSVTYMHCQQWRTADGANVGTSISTHASYPTGVCEVNLSVIVCHPGCHPLSQK